jgi:hypothetical protein
LGLLETIDTTELFAKNFNYYAVENITTVKVKQIK